MTFSTEYILEKLRPFVSQHKLERMTAVASRRTRHITLVFEDIDKPHNISAVLRTAECMGIQEVHFIKNRFDYRVNPAIVMGSVKWLTLHHHNQFPAEQNVYSCFDYLRSKGYRIYATSLHGHSILMDDMPVHHHPMAIVFGSEGSGVSELTLSLCDGSMHIPMVGFTESFNLSVSAALILNTLLSKLKQSEIDFYLSKSEQNDLLAEWFRRSVREADRILARQE
jgi:tRNA (guanosine-2'-O-)-methyltransferase